MSPELGLDRTSGRPCVRPNQLPPGWYIIKVKRENDFFHWRLDENGQVVKGWLPKYLEALEAHLKDLQEVNTFLQVKLEEKSASRVVAVEEIKKGKSKVHK